MLFFAAWLRRLTGASRTVSLSTSYSRVLALLLRIIASARDSLSFAAPFPPLMSSSLLSSRPLPAVGLRTGGLGTDGLGTGGLGAAGFLAAGAVCGFFASTSTFFSFVAVS